MLTEQIKYEEMQDEIEFLKTSLEIEEKIHSLREEIAIFNEKKLKKDVKRLKYILALMSLPVLFTLYCIWISIPNKQIVDLGSDPIQKCIYVNTTTETIEFSSPAEFNELIAKGKLKIQCGSI